MSSIYTAVTDQALPTTIKLGYHAASLLIRRASGEVLWARRGDSAPFLAGYWALPGGMVSEDDQTHSAGDTSLELRRAALREAQEEIGLPTLRGSAYSALERALSYGGGWRTHAYIPRSIEGHTFELDLGSHPEVERALRQDLAFSSLLDALPDKQLSLPVSEGSGIAELSQARWLTPAALEARWDQGEVILAPPTLALCRVASAGLPLHRAREHSPELLALNQVNPEVQLLALRTPTLPPATHTNCYLIGQGEFIIVDPGASDPHELAILYRIVDARIARGERLVAAMITHSHTDHIGGLEAVLTRYTTPLWAHPESAARCDLGGDIEVKPLSDGATLTLAPLERVTPRDVWRVWHTPGHAPGHLCLINEHTRAAIVGDMVAGVGTILIDPDDGDLAEYLVQLERLRAAELRCLLPSHGPPIAAPSALLSHYITHRKAREEKIWSALPRARSLAEGGGGVVWRRLYEIVDNAYADAPALARAGRDGGLAGRSALSHLIHLQRHGRALCSDPEPKPDSRWIALGSDPRLDELSRAAQRVHAMMTTLRVQCPWDRRQTLESLERYLIEESYEVLDVLRHGAPAAAHRDELGDLLFQVVFQSKLREEEGAFDLADVMNALASKLARRHPHIFGALEALTPEEAKAVWHRVKAEERARRAERAENNSTAAPQLKVSSALDDIPRAAPALLRAELIGERAASVGFDWPSVAGALAKVDEERAEVAEALELGSHEELISEIGDLFFAVVNVCRHLKISPEVALERTNQTFTRRFQDVERLAARRDLKLNELTIEALEALWCEVKSRHRDQDQDQDQDQH